MRDDFENRKDEKNEIRYTRYIASFMHKYLGDYWDAFEALRQWLEHLGLQQEDIDNIYFLATNGKMELETDAMIFLKDYHPDYES